MRVKDDKHITILAVNAPQLLLQFANGHCIVSFITAVFAIRLQ
jgi:hypothetical protein